ncbi:MAG: hypothetical protein KBD53_09885 [Candidatus Omnitrophica bacterium]|nr:hypothetical protein [Candidatus Omnitrophota bacterium]
MKKNKTRILMLMLFCLLYVPSWVFAEEEGEPEQNQYHVTVLPARYVSITGDKGKFRSHHWISDGYSWGIEDLFFKKDYENDVGMSFEGGVIPGENDGHFHLLLTKESAGFFDLQYQIFKKYFDNTGGVYHPFSTLESNDMEKDLEMDISDLHFETGTDPEASKGLGFEYKRHYKDGVKSRLTWTAVKEGATTRNIGPAWQDIKEKSDTFTLKQRTDLAGFDVSSAQSYERIKIKSLREEQNLSTSGVASDTKKRRQFQIPETDIYSASLLSQKWIVDETAFISTGYRFQDMEAREWESLLEFDQYGNPRSFSNPKNKPNALAENDLNSHTWTGSYLNNALEHFTFNTKFKGEVIEKRSTSLYPNDSTDPPDGIINDYESNVSENNVTRTGENFSVRYNGLPKTSLYTDVDLEQTRNWLAEELWGVAGSDPAPTSSNFNRETITNINKTILSLGSRTALSRSWNFTTQYRQRWENNDYDDTKETSGGSTARSAFIEEMKINGSDASTRISWKMLKWFETGFRYQLLRNKYFTRIDSNPQKVESRYFSHRYTYDVNLQPIETLLLTMSYSFEDGKTSTPAASGTSARIPGFNSDSRSVLLSASYAAMEKLNINGSCNYILSNNFNDFTSSGLPYALDFTMYDTSLGMEWEWKKDVTIIPRYSYYNYDSNPLVDLGDYSSHVIWLETKVNW